MVHTKPLVFNMDMLGGLTPFRSDFCDVRQSPIARKVNVVGKGIVLCQFDTKCDNIVYIPSHVFHMPITKIQLESPQSLFTKLGGQSHAMVDGKWQGHRVGPP